MMQAVEALRLKRQAVQIATQLPENKEEALKVLDYARELVQWEAENISQCGQELLRLIG